MSDAPRYKNLRDYLRVLREQRLVVVLCTLLFGGAALVFSAREEQRYAAESSLSFRDEIADIGEASTATPDTPEGRAAKAAQQVTELDVARGAQERLGTRLSPDKLLDAVEGDVEARTNLVVVTAEAGDPRLAADIANAFAQSLAAKRTKETRDQYALRARTLRTELRTLEQRARRSARGQIDTATARALQLDRITRLEGYARFANPVDIVARAEPEEDPISPRPLRNTIVGALLGLTLGMLLAFARDLLDRRFRRVDEVREALELPLVGHVREDAMGRSVVGNGRKPLADEELEAFRILRTNLDFLDVDAPLRTVMVTSALPEEGKSTVAAALAFAYAAGGRRTLLVECDLRRPTLAGRLSLQDKPGLTDFLAGHAQPAEVLQTVSVTPPPVNGSGPGAASTLVVITAGSHHPQPAELLGSQRFGAFLDDVAQAYDIVVLDTSPLLPVVDTLELVPRVDGVVLCVRATRTTREQARAASAQLSHFPKRPTGVVVTGLRPGDEEEYGSYSYAYRATAKA
jgi:capsular exopolysaccharide synthesis family protein